jgi:hypothetical protein
MKTALTEILYRKIGCQSKATTLSLRQPTIPTWLPPSAALLKHEPADQVEAMKKQHGLSCKS